MRRVLNRETFIALRARRTSHQIASEIVNPHVDVKALPCAACGADVPLDRLRATQRCPRCGNAVRLSVKRAPPFAQAVPICQHYVEPALLTQATRDLIWWVSLALLAVVLAGLMILAAAL